MYDAQIRTALQACLYRLYSVKEMRALKAFTCGAERPNIWLEAILLGPIAGALATGSYYLGLTDKRIVLLALSWWSGRPTEKVSEIYLGRITGMQYKPGWLTGKLNIYYGGNIR